MQKTLPLGPQRPPPCVKQNDGHTYCCILAKGLWHKAFTFMCLSIEKLGFYTHFTDHSNKGLWQVPFSVSSKATNMLMPGSGIVNAGITKTRSQKPITNE